ncbi:MAG: hypothetical protein ACR2RB_05015 [Gammaproteobacteria bacterium]
MFVLMPHLSLRRGLAAICLTSTVFMSPAAFALTFDQVCALATTINCWDFENEDDLYYVWPTDTSCDNDTFLQNHPNGRNGFGLDRQGSKGDLIANTDNEAGACIYPARDGTFASSGNYSLKFTMPSQSGPETSGDFNPVFKRLGEPPDSTFARFGKGGEFWVRFSMRQSPELITTSIEASSGSFGGIKRIIVHGYRSSESLEETINDGFERRVPQMYSDSGTEDYGIQDAAGCGLRNPDEASSYPEPPCRRFKANVWRTYQIHVVVADNAEKDNGLVELYVDDEQQPIIRVTDSDMSGLEQDEPYTEQAVWDDVTNGYGKLTFTLFSTNKDPAQIHPEAYMWIDDVAISHVRVPLVTRSTTGDTARPDSPTGLRVD